MLYSQVTMLWQFQNSKGTQPYKHMWAFPQTSLPWHITLSRVPRATQWSLLAKVFKGLPVGSGLSLRLPAKEAQAWCSAGGAKIPHASEPKIQNTKQKQCCNRFSEDFRKGPHQKRCPLLPLLLNTVLENRAMQRTKEIKESRRKIKR